MNRDINNKPVFARRRGDAGKAEQRIVNFATEDAEEAGQYLLMLKPKDKMLDFSAVSVAHFIFAVLRVSASPRETDVALFKHIYE